jgi:regulator of replication initiation timing
MQANRQEVFNQIHETVQSTVSKMYARIDSIIQSAKEYVEANPEKGEEIVQHVTNYTRYMHRVIDSIVESYSAFLKSEEPNVKEFKENVSQYITRAKNATLKIQSLIA